MANIFGDFMQMLAQGSAAFGMTPETKETMDYQRKLNLQNEYDKYSAQVGGMIRAGLNPALMMTNGSSSISGTSASMGQSNSGLLQALLSMVTSLAVNRNEVDAQKSIARIQQDTAFGLQRREQQFQSDYMKTNVEMNQLKNEFQRIENRIKESSSADVLKHIHNNAQLSTQEVLNAKMYRQNLSAQISLLRQQAKTEETKQNLNAALSVLNNAQSWQIYRLTDPLSQLHYASANYTATLNESETIKQVGYKTENALMNLEKTMRDIDIKVSQWRWTSKDFNARMYRSAANGFGQVFGAVGTLMLGGAAVGKLFGSSPTTYQKYNAYTHQMGTTP